VSLPENEPGITPISRLFTYHIFGEPVELDAWRRDPSSYRLQVTGLVRRPLSLSLGDLRALDIVGATVVLQCTTNVHWGRLEVRGVPLAEVVRRAVPREGARKLAIRGADGFTSDLLLGEVLAEPPRFLLALEVNGADVTGEHGWPVRVVSEGKYGYKWCKWVVGVEVTDRDFKGHYEGRRGWSDAGTRGTRVTGG
jgi:DMSO/TMAO reductase YedYZ molybdopterin-dependent catalytic subunit